MKLNPNIARSLGMSIPDEESEPITTPIVAPHEIIPDDNSELPQLADIDYRQLEGEKQLEMIIRAGMDSIKTIKDGYNMIEAKYRSRYIEVMNGTMGLVLDAIKHKTNLQNEKIKLRMERASFSKSKNGQSGGGSTNNNFFFGSREEILKLMDNAIDEAMTPDVPKIEKSDK